jgi:hypothetical protein
MKNINIWTTAVKNGVNIQTAGYNCVPIVYKGPFKYYVSAGLGGWVQKLGRLLTVQRLGGWVRNILIMSFIY